ncbi:MAG TPA: bifunctional DNA primase/polymerase, partial [Terracidiphilus sp.]|nr:bifunctional DNA primase/polymerase [Terracidiphilus sp.]
MTYNNSTAISAPASLLESDLATFGKMGIPPEVSAAAQRGWPVFPLHSPTARGCSCERAECAKPAKHPRTAHGLKDASRDAETIREWWTRWPDANIGIATGQPSGFFVIDVDGEAGRASVAELARQGLTLPSTLTVTTGRPDGGEHRYFRMPEGVDIRNDQSGRIGPHIDVRGTGGFVVAAGSTHASGKIYRFVDPLAAIADAPAWVIERLAARSDPPAAPLQPAQDTAKVTPKGQRTRRMVSLAGTLHRRNVSVEAIEACLAVENQAKADPSNPPLRPEKVRAIARDIPTRYESGGPDVLEVAVELLAEGNHQSLRDKFAQLCIILQRLLGDGMIILPCQRIGESLGCDYSLVARFRRKAVAEGWLRQERPPIMQKQAAKFRVIADPFSTTVLQEATQAARTTGQRSGQMRCDMTAQGGDGAGIMPFGSRRQRLG